MPWRGPSYRGELPTLGYYALDWMSETLADPSRADGTLLLPTREQAQFILNFYVLDPRTCRRRFRRAALSRSKGWGKSPLLAGLLALEALGEVVPDGWDADGEPVGRPWESLRYPLVQAVAYSEKQVDNCWIPLLSMLRDGPARSLYPGLEVLDTFVNLPGRGKIEPVTAAAESREGNPVVFAVYDQTESWTRSNGGTNLAATVRRNVAKANGTTVEAPNAYLPGAQSVAEDTAIYAHAIAEGRALDDGLYYDHREASADTDIHDRKSLLRGLKHAYHGPWDPQPWINLQRLADEFRDFATDPQDARRYYLNQVTHAPDSWVSKPEWGARYNSAAGLADAEVITLGFDGSRGRRRGTADATALIGCRVADGYEFEIGIWEQPEGPAGRGWTPPEHEVDAAVHRTFDRFTVVGFFADPSMWDGHVARWESKYGPRLKVKASGSSKIRYPKNQMSRVVAGLKSMHAAILSGELSHDGSAAFGRHVVNARRRVYRTGVYIAKENESSPNKIDGAYAGMLAWVARLDAVAAGLHVPKQTVPRRIR